MSQTGDIGTGVKSLAKTRPKRRAAKTQLSNNWRSQADDGNEYPAPEMQAIACIYKPSKAQWLGIQADFSYSFSHSGEYKAVLLKRHEYLH